MISNTSIKMQFFIILLIKGIKKAAVLPVPVLAIPTTSCPSKMCGMILS
jgi:hypothetical protein